jgi:hypothetical protein
MKRVLPLVTQKKRILTSPLQGLVMVLVLIAAPCAAMPSVLIEKGGTKCVLVEAAIDTMLRVDYEAGGRFFRDVFRDGE